MDNTDTLTPELQVQPAVLRATIQITRATTGKVEAYELVGTAEPSAPIPQPKET